jgi:hypothetical protein
VTDHPWRLVAIAFAAGASLGRRRDPASIVKNLVMLLEELMAAVAAERAQSWIDQTERLAASARPQSS